MSHIFLLRIEEEREYEYGMFWKHISPNKRAALLNYKFEKDRVASILGEALLRYGMMKVYKIDHDFDIFYGKYQKPYLKSHNLYFNISHSGDYVLCAIDESEIGVDIEKYVLKADELLVLAEQFFTKHEHAAMLEVMNRKSYFYDIWTLKECYLKYKGYGLHKSLDSFEFYFEEDQIFLTDFTKQCAREQQVFSLLKQIPDYSIAICGAEKVLNEDIQVVSYDLICNVLKYDFNNK